VTGRNFRDGDPVTNGTVDSVVDYPVTANTRSKMTTYWPYTAIQNGDGSLQLITYLVNDPSGPWVNSTMDLAASMGSGLAIVPQTASEAAPPTAGLLFRNKDGNLDGQWVKYNTTGTSWYQGSGMLSPI
jgi:hypothetical protein